MECVDSRRKDRLGGWTKKWKTINFKSTEMIEKVDQSSKEERRLITRQIARSTRKCNCAVHSILTEDQKKRKLIVKRKKGSTPLERRMKSVSRNFVQQSFASLPLRGRFPYPNCGLRSNVNSHGNLSWNRAQSGAALSLQEKERLEDPPISWKWCTVLYITFFWFCSTKLFRSDRRWMGPINWPYWAEWDVQFRHEAWVESSWSHFAPGQRGTTSQAQSPSSAEIFGMGNLGSSI